MYERLLENIITVQVIVLFLLYLFFPILLSVFFFFPTRAGSVCTRFLACRMERLLECGRSPLALSSSPCTRTPRTPRASELRSATHRLSTAVTQHFTLPMTPKRRRRPLILCRLRLPIPSSLRSMRTMRILATIADALTIEPAIVYGGRLLVALSSAVRRATWSACRLYLWTNGADFLIRCTTTVH
ncbi:uncharacterized protein M6B38_264815 [Iris pallida]|uniref:Uncharacterized protein n=1 Tax=Iris pallida TaxID=29817 RepID=A0AAX6IC73_IRIPA|nr:uncharacterized protein M6B38_264815 [Iris pallida]